jgi:predicted AAA+ superfamily ATPase
MDCPRFGRFSGYVIRVIPPWFENLKKRQIKSPKVYIRDNGLLHYLLGIEDIAGLRSHPKQCLLGGFCP